MTNLNTPSAEKLIEQFNIAVKNNDIDVAIKCYRNYFQLVGVNADLRKPLYALELDLINAIKEGNLNEAQKLHDLLKNILQRIVEITGNDYQLYGELNDNAVVLQAPLSFITYCREDNISIDPIAYYAVDNKKL